MSGTRKEEKVDSSMLMAIQNTLGIMQNTLGGIEATVTSLKEDITELKQKDIAQSQNQDAIRDDLQHQIDALELRIQAIENKKEKVLVKWWDRLVDKLMWVLLIAAVVVLLKWLGAPAEVLSQLPH